MYERHLSNVLAPEILEGKAYHITHPERKVQHIIWYDEAESDMRQKVFCMDLISATFAGKESDKSRNLK